MKIVILIILYAAMSFKNVYSETIVNCSNPKGHTYFRYQGLVEKELSGWTEDKIAGGKFTVTKNKDEDFDILFFDAKKKITSSRDSGANIFQLSNDGVSFNLLSIYENSTIELYSFWIDNSGEMKFSLSQSKNGLFPKSTLLVGECSHMKIPMQ